MELKDRDPVTGFGNKEDFLKRCNEQQREEQCVSLLWTERPWGKFVVLSEGPGFTVKHLIVYPGGKTSIQSHEGREEFWTVADGVATIVYGEDMSSISTGSRKKGATFHVKQGQIHRLQNDQKEDLHVVEIWSGEILSEDDITRYQDSYGRVE